MTATVVSLESRRKAGPPPTPAERTCPCRIGHVCRSHRVSNLAGTVRAYLERHGAELLTDAADVAVLLDHALDVLDGIIDETYPTEDRSTAR